MSVTSKYMIYISCPPGLEPALAGELKGLRLAAEPVKNEEDTLVQSGEEPGGIEIEGGLEDIYRCNLHLRTASRVVVRLGSFYAAAFSELRKKGSRLPWEQFIKPGANLLFKVTCHKSKLYHSDAVAERVLGAVNDHLEHLKKPACVSLKDKPGQLVLVRINHDFCVISIDSSGELLHRRGYRLATAKAPLRENLAAGILLASGWDGTTPLIDPFCGSGTFPIEAGLIANHVSPGIAREFQFTTWPIHQAELWQSQLQTARMGILHSDIPIQGSDRDSGAIESSKANAARAGLKDRITFKQQAVSFIEPLAVPGWIVTNPPYGVRVSEGKDLRDLYARFGSIFKQKFSGWTLALLSNDDALVANLGLGSPTNTIRLLNGGIPVKLNLFSHTQEG